LGKNSHQPKMIEISEISIGQSAIATKTRRQCFGFSQTSSAKA